MFSSLIRAVAAVCFFAFFGSPASAQCVQYVDGICTMSRGSPQRSRAARVDENGIQNFTQSLRNRKAPLPLARDVFNYFDLSIEGVCGPDGFANEADNFIAAAANYFLIKESRAIALTVTLSETGPSAITQEKEIPLVIAKPDTGKPTVDCSRVIRSGAHRSVSTKLKFNFYVSKEKFQVSTTGSKITAFLTALLSLDSRMFTIPSGVVAAAGAKVFLADLEKISTATNALLADFEKKTDDTTIIDINENEGGVSIKVGARAALVVRKTLKDTILFDGPTFKGGSPFATFKSVTGQDFAQLTVNVDGSQLGKSASDDQRRMACSNVRTIVTQQVVGDDALLMMNEFVTGRAILLQGHKGFNCILPDEARRLRDVIKAKEPYGGAYNQAIAQETPPDGDARDTFAMLRDRLKILATQLKTMSVIQQTPDFPQKSKIVNELKTNLSSYFAEQVSIDGAARDPLFPLTAQTFTDTEVGEQITKWPAVNNFGCFLPIAKQAGKEQKYILEALLRVETAPRPTIYHLQMNAAASGEGVLISELWVTKLGTAKIRFADKFKQGCGDKAPFWLPWKEMDDWTAEGRIAGHSRPVGKIIAAAAIH